MEFGLSHTLQLASSSLAGHSLICRTFTLPVSDDWRQCSVLCCCWQLEDAQREGERLRKDSKQPFQTKVRTARTDVIARTSLDYGQISRIIQTVLTINAAVKEWLHVALMN